MKKTKYAEEKIVAAVKQIEGGRATKEWPTGATLCHNAAWRQGQPQNPTNPTSSRADKLIAAREEC